MLATKTDDRQFRVSPPETVVRARVSGDSTHLLAVSGIGPSTVTVWRIADGKKLLEKRYSEGVFDADLSPDARLVAIALRSSSNRALIERIDGGAAGDGPIIAVPKPRESLSAVRFHPDGRRLALGSGAGAIYLSDLDTGDNTAVTKLRRGDQTEVTDSSMSFT